jgi:hypothetical protein
MFAAQVERVRSASVHLLEFSYNAELQMADPQLPKADQLQAPVAKTVMLRSVGSILRAHYGEVVNEPVPARLKALLRWFL